MNLLHRRLCSSASWARQVAERMPGMLAGAELGDDVLEIGPGYGATTRALVALAPRLTAVEIEEASVRLLRAEFADRVDVVHGDGTSLPFPDGRFSAVVCFTMLHHVPSPALQDALFAEACRVLRPSGVFRGVDSVPSIGFRLGHIGDTMVPVEAATLPDRLREAGFDVESVERRPHRQISFTAYRPSPTRQHSNAR